MIPELLTLVAGAGVGAVAGGPPGARCAARLARLHYRDSAEFATGCAAACASAAPPLQQQPSRNPEPLPVTQPLLL